MLLMRSKDRGFAESKVGGGLNTYKGLCFKGWCLEGIEGRDPGPRQLLYYTVVILKTCTCCSLGTVKDKKQRIGYDM